MTEILITTRYIESDARGCYIRLIFRRSVCTQTNTRYYELNFGLLSRVPPPRLYHTSANFSSFTLIIQHHEISADTYYVNQHWKELNNIIIRYSQYDDTITCNITTQITEFVFQLSFTGPSQT